MTKDDVDAYWFGTAQSGHERDHPGPPPAAARTSRSPGSRTTAPPGAEALRAAAYAVASGAYDVAMAVGAEKVKDSGYQGLNANNPPNDGTARTLTAAAMFSMVAPAYGAEVRRGRGDDDRRPGHHRRRRTTTTAPATHGPSSARR